MPHRTVFAVADATRIEVFGCTLRGMTAGILAIAGIALGAALGRWWLAPVAGMLAAAATLALTPFSDSPFLLVGAVVTLATSVGVAASRAHRSVSNQER